MNTSLPSNFQIVHFCKSLLTLLVSALFLGLAACATPATPENSARIDEFSDPPTRAEYFRAAEEAIRMQLIDPRAAIFYWPNSVMRTTWQVPFGPRYSGYVTCGLVNSRNRFGGYVGNTPTLVIYNHGRVIHSEFGTSTSDIDFTNSLCDSTDFVQNFEWREEGTFVQWSDYLSQNGTLDENDDTLSDGSYFDCLELATETGRRYRARLISREFDSYLILRSGGCRSENTVTANDDFGGGALDAEIYFDGAPNLHLVINSYAAGETGSYQLTIDQGDETQRQK